MLVFTLKQGIPAECGDHVRQILSCLPDVLPNLYTKDGDSPGLRVVTLGFAKGGAWDAAGR